MTSFADNSYEKKIFELLLQNGGGAAMIEENDWRITDQTKYLARPIEKSSVSQAQPHMEP
jgi:hypothetical protein